MGNRVCERHAVTPAVTIEIVEGDITREPVEAIVNAANSLLQHGGGVAAAIARAAGPALLEESRAVAPVPVGGAKATTAGALPQRYVIHAVGPRWGEGDEERKLRSAVRSALERAAELGVSSVSLPAISTGIFGFPADRAAEILLDEALAFAHEHPDGPPRTIRFCLWGDAMAKRFRDTLARRTGDATKR